MGEAAQSTKSINLFHSSLPQLFKKKRNKEIGLLSSLGQSKMNEQGSSMKLMKLVELIAAALDGPPAYNPANNKGKGNPPHNNKLIFISRSGRMKI